MDRPGPSGRDITAAKRAALSRLPTSLTSTSMQHAYPPPTAVFSPPLKRNRSGDFPRPPAEIPPLPDLRVEFTLEVFTHESIRLPNAAKGEGFTDNTRLTVLGERVLGCAITLALFKRRPPLSADDLIVSCFGRSSTSWCGTHGISPSLGSKEKDIR